MKNKFGRVIAVLEVSAMWKTDNWDDKKYFAIVLACFIRERVETCVKLRVFSHEIKVKNEIFKAYLDLCKSHDLFDAAAKIKTWIPKIYCRGRQS